MPSARTRISAYGRPTPEQEADEARRYNQTVDRDAASAAAIERNGGRSAPQSARSRPIGLTPQAQWNSMFPRISAYGTGLPTGGNLIDPQHRDIDPGMMREDGIAPLPMPINEGVRTPQTMGDIHPLPGEAPTAGRSLAQILPKQFINGVYNSPAQTAGLLGEDWRGREGVANPPPMLHSGAPGSEGAVLPSNAANYKGISAYNDPDAGGARVIEYDPSKDMRYSKMGVTSGANTAQGIQDKYQTPGTTAKFTPGTVTDNNGNVMNQGGDVWNRDAARASLYQSHPEVWQAGTDKNKAFAEYAAQHGEQAAHANIDTILGGATQANKPNSTTPMPAPGPNTSGPDANQINAYA